MAATCSTLQVCALNFDKSYDCVLVDSGAQVCCCPQDYAPEISNFNDPYDRPVLQSVTGKPIQVFGYKYIEYELKKNYKIIVKYYVCDVKNLVVSKSGLVQAGNELHFGTSNSISRGSLISKLTTIDGLSYLKVHSSKRTSPTSLAIKGSATTPTSTGLVAVQRRADRDYWKLEGSIATRVHVKPRKELFNPAVATTNPNDWKRKR